jgi:ubiquinone/menaquinone biosynthesis C-methylase UbiE
MEVLDELLVGHDITGQNWLDAGCGTGTLARFLAERKGCKVLGVDASQEMISRCAPDPNTEIRQIRDICEIGLPDATFDGVLCSSRLEYVPDPLAALRELRRFCDRMVCCLFRRQTHTQLPAGRCWLSTG